jgi:phosphoribosylformimino-5-aminoimidazole carboxamide ribotide isomerase
VVAALAAGAAQVVIGSQAVRDPQLVCSWLAEFGAERLIIGADFRDDIILTHGWQETSDLRLDDFISTWLAAGATTFLCTDVQRDGVLAGPATARYATLTAAFPAAQILASGGVSGLADLAALRPTGVAGVVIGKALYEGRIPFTALAAQ